MSCARDLALASRIYGTHVAPALRVTCGALALFTLSCGDDVAPATQFSVLPAEVLHVPALGCFSSIDSAGSCRRTADCELDRRCVFDASARWQDRDPVPLTCASALGEQPGGEHCRVGSDCQSGLCSLANLCLEPCNSSDDCSDDRTCRPIETRVGDGLGPIMACARTLALPDDVSITLGHGASDMHKGRSTLRLPGTGDRALIYVQADCDARGFDLLELFSIDLQRKVYDRQALGAGARQANTVLHDGSPLAAILFPDNPSLPAAWLGLTVDVKASARQHADVVVASRPNTGRLLDLDIFYVGGGVDVTGDATGFHPGEPRVADMLARLDHRYRALGLGLGSIHEHDVAGALRDELGVLSVPESTVNGRTIQGRPDRLGELFALSAGVESAGIDVFIIRDMGDYIGIAGGIPGVLGLHGSERSGVAIAAEMLGELGDADLVLMHELGHFLGLFHTTEGSGTVLDPLPDTPECDIALDENADHELSTVECADHGGDNLMFWTGVGSLLTTQQIAVMAESVIFH